LRTPDKFYKYLKEILWARLYIIFISY
jgi:hypothetical protein